MSSAITLDERTCMCRTPQLASFNDGRLLPLDSPNVTIVCEQCGGCAAEAIRIVSRQNWRGTHEPTLAT